MRKQIVLVLLVPILALTLISCDADMRSSFADFLGVFGNNVYIEGGLVEANKEEAKAAASTVASFGATGTATVTGGGSYTGFGVNVAVPAGVTAVMPPQSKDDRDKLNDELAGIIASTQLTGFKEEMSHKVEDADRKNCEADGPVETGHKVIEDDDGFVALAKLANDVTTDVASAACDENAHVGFRSENGGRKSERLAWIGPFGERICANARVGGSIGA